MTSPVLWRNAAVIMFAGCLISMIGFGVRSSFGLFLEPMTAANGWSRETFALALAIQNLVWGLGVPIAGALADRHGPFRVLAAGALLYATGVWGMAEASSSMMLYLFGGVVAGLGVASTVFAIALSAMARAVGPEKRSLALGLGTAAGSAGQVVFAPLGLQLIEVHGWYIALILIAVIVVAIVPLAFLLPGGTDGKGEAATEQTMSQALHEAFQHRGYVLLTTGFFVCGFHVAFIAVHLPAYVSDLGFSPEVGAYSLALIGLMNIAGSFLAGVVGQKFSKKSSLALIYLARAACIAAFLSATKSEINLYLFASAMGLLWLSTVPLTSGIVAQIFGVKYMATLFGVVFFSHQLGSFTGVWLGGYLYDTIGSYDPVWWAGVVLGIVAALLHMPINEKPLNRVARASP